MPNDFILSSATTSIGRTAHYAQLTNTEQPRFIIGYRTMYEGNTGLFNTKVTTALVYDPDDHVTKFGFWAYFIYPTAKAESNGSYYCLNTYDRARFTFGFMQYAAHVPGGDFVKFFKKLLQLPEAGNYFPKLVVSADTIFYRSSNGALTQLESGNSTEALMNYLNPSLSEVENQELICSARMVHWAMNAENHRATQVNVAVDHFKAKMIEYDRRFNLEGVPAKVCQVICDIRHQGRSGNDRIAAALNTSGDYEKAYQNLLTIGSANYSERISSLKNSINELINSGIFLKIYRRTDNTFINM